MSRDSLTREIVALPMGHSISRALRWDFKNGKLGDGTVAGMLEKLRSAFYQPVNRAARETSKVYRTEGTVFFARSGAPIAVMVVTCVEETPEDDTKGL